ncbi:hypothetical protein [uncultured Ruegeria sp.]|uniref:hypothetical protein n=1 Tax=uncultured Ruegeria sp. TaxID=259304 RepID=UPI00260451A3|nr:hypothetical protein [uncultured Ruegeria sp.]
MSLREIKKTIFELRKDFGALPTHEQVRVTQWLLDTADHCIERVRLQEQNSTTAENRREAKKRETELDPKPPTKPVRVAEPSKPKKPKYSGNHAPSARKW